MRPAILLPAGLIFPCGAEGFLLAVGDDLDSIRAYPALHQQLLDGGGAVLAQAHVVNV